MDDLNGEWHYSYGGKRRSAILSSTDIAVCAGADAFRAVSQIQRRGVT